MSRCEDHMDVRSPMPPQTQGELAKEHQSKDNLHKWLEKWSEARLLGTSEHLLWGQRRAITLVLLDAQRYPVILAVYCKRGFDNAGKMTLLPWTPW